MESAPRSRFGFPEPIPAFTSFPEDVPWDVPIHKLAGWWLEVQCPTHFVAAMPLRLLAANAGWNRTLRDVVPRLKCKLCGAAPIKVDFVSYPGGDTGRQGAKTQRHALLG